MPNKMLIDSTHPEETRVVVLRGNRVEEFDFESANRKQLRGNIYLAKVTRVEPSLQAAFVDYGGNRHGFLAFSEIHPDYYQIPVADRQALIDEEERAQRLADAEADHRAGRRAQRERQAARTRAAVRSEPAGEAPGEDDIACMAATSEIMVPQAGEHGPQAEAPMPETVAHEGAAAASEPHEAPSADDAPSAQEEAQSTQEHDAPVNLAETEPAQTSEFMPQAAEAPSTDAIEPRAETDAVEAGDPGGPGEHAPQAAAEGVTSEDAVGVPVVEVGSNIVEVNGNGAGGEEEAIESVGGADAMEEVPERMPRLRRQYKIQEVIKRRQVMLVQVVKEERGTKGAALTTYLSLAGRYSVLMPNTA